MGKRLRLGKLPTSIFPLPPKTMITDFEEIIKLIPQKHPIVMVDKLFYTDETITRTGFTVKEDNILFENGHLKEPGIIEHIAQTAALRAGFYYKSRNENPPIGFIGAIKNLTINFLPKAGELETEIKVETEIMNATVITAHVKQNGEVVAEGEMKIFIMGDKV